MTFLKASIPGSHQICSCGFHPSGSTTGVPACSETANTKPITFAWLFAHSSCVTCVSPIISLTRFLFRTTGTGTPAQYRSHVLSGSSANTASGLICHPSRWTELPYIMCVGVSAEMCTVYSITVSHRRVFLHLIRPTKSLGKIFFFNSLKYQRSCREQIDRANTIAN